MALGYNDITLGTQTLNLTSVSRNKVPGSIKQKVGGSLVRHQIPARTTRDWSLSGRGVIIDTAATTATALRATLESYDDNEKRHYSDGLITGSFIITDLKFDDKDSSPMHFEYSISLIEYNN